MRKVAIHKESPKAKGLRTLAIDAGITGGIHLWDDSVWPKEQGTAVAQPKSVRKRRS
jgi:hypothetical protein